MKSTHRQTRLEWAFLAGMMLVCGVLGYFQYEWAGGIATAELERLRDSLSQRLHNFCRAFEAELNAHTVRLHPTQAEIQAEGRDNAHLTKLRAWAVSDSRPVFRRLALAVPENGRLGLRMLDADSNSISPAEWPADWIEFRSPLLLRLNQPQSHHYVTPDGRQVLLQIHADTEADKDSKGGWLIAELDPKWLRENWLPSLMRIYVHPDETVNASLRILQAGDRKEIVFSSGIVEEKVVPVLAIHFHSPIPHSGDTGRLGPNGRWLLEYRQRPGAFEAAVGAARRKNFIVAVALNALILAACFALVRYTRRSREFASAQMDFVANVSHELRTPLTVIRGAAHNLQHGVVGEPERVREYAGLIAGHATQLGSMVEQVLEFATASRKRGKENFMRLDIAPVIRAALHATAQETAAANCEVVTDIPDSLPSVNGDASSLTRAIQNLISNAARHGASGGWIGVSAAQAPDGAGALEIRVSDRGPGVPEEEREKIFRPFERGTQAQAAQVRGSGIGLGLVREIVTAHGGTVTVRENPEGGTTFTIRIPTA